MKRLSIIVLSLVAAAATAMAAARVDTLSIESRKIVAPAKFVVALPDGYETSENWPVVYLLHGYGDNYKYYSGKTDLGDMATRFETIIVCPDGRNSWYWNSPVDTSMQMEDFIVNELVPDVDNRYKTSVIPENRAINGLSMGGHGALWLAMRHPDVWGNAGSMSGGVDITPAKFHNKWQMAKRLGSYDANPRRWREHSVKYLAETLPVETLRELNIIVMCGTEDFFYNVNCELDHVLNVRKVGHTYITGPGDHSWNYWEGALETIMDFFAVNFKR